MSDVLDLQRLAPKLDDLVEQARSSTGVDGELLIKQARRLLTKAREAQVLPDRTAEPARWHGVAGRNLPTGEDVTCWRGEACLYGAWDGDRLQLVQLTVGEAAWGMRMTSSGASHFATTDAAIDGPADRRMGDRIKREIATARQRVAREFAARTRVCPRCSWVNDRDGDPCAFCGNVDPPWEKEPWQAVPEEFGRAEPAGPTHEPAVPQGYEAGAIPELVSEPMPRRVGTGGVEAGPRGDVVLDGFDPNRKVSVVQAVMDARELTGDKPNGLAHAKELVENVPAIICTDISAARAAAIQRLLERAGASSRFRRRDG
jgi:ribosomal protein L7/L12